MTATANPEGSIIIMHKYINMPYRACLSSEYSKMRFPCLYLYIIIDEKRFAICGRILTDLRVPQATGAQPSCRQQRQGRGAPAPSDTQVRPPRHCTPVFTDILLTYTGVQSDGSCHLNRLVRLLLIYVCFSNASAMSYRYIELSSISHAPGVIKSEANHPTSPKGITSAMPGA